MHSPNILSTVLDVDPELVLARTGGLVTDDALAGLTTEIPVAADRCRDVIAVLEVCCRSDDCCYASVHAYGRLGRSWELLMENGDRWLSPRTPRPPVGAGAACVSSRTSFSGDDGRFYGTVAGIADLGTAHVGVRSSCTGHITAVDRCTGGFVVIVEIAAIDEHFTVHGLDVQGGWSASPIA